MSRHERSPSRESFELQLEALRSRIDMLPEAQRPHLYELANTIQEQVWRNKKHELADDKNN